MPNRLANAASTYLQQHQDNPVDWYPWGDEAFEKAAREDKPVFLSVGYSSCHWCHVMAHESFEDEAVAELLNADFVSVKVDREELPDVDETYMLAVQLSSGRGGWPMSVFLTPDRKPFFAGTYFPKEDRGGHPGFMSVLQQIAIAWKSDRPKVLDIANQHADAILQSREREMDATATLSEDLLNECVRKLSMDFDEERGGFGQAPKFPPHTAIEFLLNYAISDFGGEDLRQAAADMALYTLEQMALGGLQDHVGGGFHRYSTDAEWLLPHFEKMLGDNALMLGNYARAAALCHEQLPQLESLFSRTVDGILHWLKSEMMSPTGLYFSAVDADSEGEEGKYYAWTAKEMESALGKDAAALMSAYQIAPGGNYRDEATGQPTGLNIPHLREMQDDPMESALEKLRTVRDQRVKPGLDRKALVGWNGLVMSALSEAAEIELAEQMVDSILKAEEEHGHLPRQITDQGPSGVAYLEDFAYLIQGIIALASVKSLFAGEGASAMGREPVELVQEAQRLCGEMKAKFGDPNGAFFATSADHENLFGRSKPTFDQPLPSANAIAARCLMELGDASGAWDVVRTLAGWMERAPAATEALHLVLLELLMSQDRAEPAAEIESRKVSVTLLEDRLMALNGVAEGTVAIQIPSGLHVNSPKPDANWLTPTSVTISGLQGEVHYPEAEQDRYEGLVHIPFRVELPVGVGAQEVEIRVKWQACTEQECHLAEEVSLDCLVQAT